MEWDKKHRWRGSVLHHGKQNNRIYLMRLDPADTKDIVPYLDGLAKREGYEKIFAKVPAENGEIFTDNGYKKEALVPGFYGGKGEAFFLAKFLTPEREKNGHKKRIESILEKAREKATGSSGKRQRKNFDITVAEEKDISEMSEVYNKVFESYPFPIHDEGYLLETMGGGVRYYVARRNGRIAGVSSSEMSRNNRNTEMTDFATLPGHRGAGIATELLDFMDADMGKEGFVTAYTIARALSCGINITFARNGYKFAGTLVNNTNISGSIESMNVWYKQLNK
jgi:beta-lysine N6-acetyltransferase